MHAAANFGTSSKPCQDTDSGPLDSSLMRDVEGVNPRDTYCKLATYHSLFAVHSYHNVRAPARLPRHMHLVLSQHVMGNVSRFRLRAHTLKVETAAWDTQNALLCDCCSCDEIQ
eukprot:1154532-Pelagomonas_calceolata.AAC.1